MKPVERFRAAHEEWREANIAESKAQGMVAEANNRYDKAKDEMEAARVTLISAVLDGTVVDAGIGGDDVPKMCVCGKIATHGCYYTRCHDGEHDPKCCRPEAFGVGIGSDDG